MGLAREWRSRDERGGDSLQAVAVEGVAVDVDVNAGGVWARAADVVGALVLLALSSPLLLVGLVLVFATGGLPVLFGHQRVGQGGRRFRCWKLRTMHSGAEERLAEDEELHRSYVANGFKLPTAVDPRVTPVGRWLRRLHVDELPQLWNVLTGDMSLVGPRPVVPKELELFGENVPALLRRRPGVFGEWTSLGRRRPPYPERVRVEMRYVEDPSVRRSARILARSIGVLLKGQGDEG